MQATVDRQLPPFGEDSIADRELSQATIRRQRVASSPPLSLADLLRG